MENIENKLTKEGQQSIINSMEFRKEGINKEIEKAKKIIERKKEDWYLPLVLDIDGTIITPFILEMIIGDRIFLPLGLPDSILGGILTNMTGYTFFTIICGTMFTLLCGFYSISDIITYRKQKRILKGLNAEKVCLEEILTNERQKLNELKENKDKVNLDDKNNDKAIDVSISLMNILAAYYNCGYNERKWSKDYVKGTLSKKLEKQDYTPEEIEVVKNYFEGKGYSRRRVRTR